MPIRTCAGCGLREQQGAMVRLQARGTALEPVERPQKLSGRSAYVHPRHECISRLERSRLLRRSLRASYTDAARASLAQRLREMIDRKAPAPAQAQAERTES